MMQTIEVPGYGEVEFPDDMTDAQIAKAIKDNYFRDGKTQKALFDEAKQAQQHAQMTHHAKPSKPKDMYARQAEGQSFIDNLGAGFGGALYGMGYLGPKSILGLNKPGEVQDWKASMSGLGNTAGGTIGQIAGYASPAAALAPIVGASVPVAAGVGAVEGALLPAESWAERGANTAFSASGAALGQAGGNALSQRMTKRAVDKANEVATKKAQNVVRDATLNMAKNEGYVVPPSYAGTGMWPRFFEGISGKYKTNQLAGIKNQQVTNSLARKELGLPENSPLTDDALEVLRKNLGQPYRDVASLPKQQAQPATSPVMPWTQPTQAVHGFDPEQALEALKQARYDARQYWRKYNGNSVVAGDPEARTLAVQADNVADAIEQQLENYARQNGSSDLIQRLKDARVAIAKTHTVEKALNEGTGDVDATKLANMLTNDVPLTGELEKVGKFGMAFRDVARPPKSGDANPVTALDLMTSVPSAGFGGMAWGGPGAAVMTLLPSATRIASRYSLLSGPVQRSLVKPKYSIGLANKVMPSLLDNPVSSAMYPGLGIYGYGVQPFAE